MKKIFLFCSNGMSTSMLASNMQSVADAHSLPIEVSAHPHGKIVEIVDTLKPDCVLLGPQVKYLLEETVDKIGSVGIPIAVIEANDYGMMNGENVLKMAVKLIKGKK